MANWNVLGGIGQGVTLGLQDVRDQKRAAQEAEMRAYQLGQMKLDKELTETLRGIQGTRPAAQFGATAVDDEGRPNVIAARGEADVARDLANTYTKFGKAEQAAAQSDRAHSLDNRAYEKRVMDFTRRASTMSPKDAAREFAALKTADGTALNAFVLDDQGELPTIRAYNADTGKYVDRAVTSQDLIDYAHASVSPAAYEKFRRAQRDDAQLGITQFGANTARVGVDNAGRRTDAEIKDINAKVTAGVYQSQVDDLKAKAVLYPAQAANYNAQAKEASARANKMTKDMNSLEAKMPEGEKMYLGILKDNMLKTQAAAAERPELAVPAMAAKLELFKYMKRKGVGDIDPYAASGVPAPTLAASAIMSDRPNAKAVVEQVQKAERMFGSEYAQEVKAALEALAAAAPKKSVGAPSNVVSRGIQGPGTADPVAFRKYRAEQDALAAAAQAERRAAQEAAIAGPMGEWEKRVLADPNAPAITTPRP